MTTVFPVKTVEWSLYGHRTPILLQEKNGPCPLIALVNTLLLQRDLEQRSVAFDGANPALSQRISTIERLRSALSGDSIALDRLLAVLGDVLLELNVGHAAVHQLLEALPMLHTGLQVNPNITDGSFPPGETATQLFAAFGLQFVHGWCWDIEQLDHAHRAVQRLQTFDAIQDYIFDTDTPVDLDTRTEIEQWFVQNKTQLTRQGLRRIDDNVAEDSVAVMFRNNHFSTLYKLLHHDFYLLITDTAFTKTAADAYVWQLLILASGSEDLFFKGDFSPISDPGVQLEATTNEDLELVRRLQEEEDAAMAQEMQSRYSRKPRDKEAERKRKEEKKWNKLDRIDAAKQEAAQQERQERKKRGFCVVA